MTIKKCKCGHLIKSHNNYQGCMHTKGDRQIGFTYCDCRIKRDALEVQDEK